MKMIKAEGIPIIITVFAIFIGFVSLFLGGQALLDGTTAIGYVDGAEALGIGWGGRNAGIGVFLLLAVLLRSPAGYSIGLLGGVMREISDMMGTGFTAPLIIFTLIELTFFVICFRAAWQNWQPRNTADDANLLMKTLDYMRPIVVAGLVTIFAIFIGLVGTSLGVGALLDPTTAIGYVDGADVLGLGWAGRNVALALGLLIAVILRDPAGYAVAISGSLMREISDIMSTEPFSIPLFIFLLVELIFFAICLRAALTATLVTE